MKGNKFNFARFCRALPLFAALISVASSSLVAQTTTGSIRGFVRDAAGNPLPDAQVIARDPALGTTRGVSANESGFYALAGLRPATYNVTVRRIGSEAQSRTVDVGIGQTLAIDFGLSTTAQTLEAVVVESNTGSETKTSEVATNITRQQIQDLPSKDRNFLDLATLAPGVRATPVGNISKQIAGPAGQPENINVFVDGASFKNDVLEGGAAGQNSSQGNPFPQNAVQEFRVITQNYKAEYQKASSTIIVATTRTGSNNTEVGAFVYGIAPGFIAKDKLSVQRGDPNPNFRRYQFGANVGGPIVKDKIHYFASYEANLKDQPASVIPGTAPAGFPFNPQTYAGAFTQNFREHLGFGKLTFTPNENNTFDLSGTLRKEYDLRGFGNFGSDPLTSREAAEKINNNVYNGAALWKYTGAAWFNEAQANYQWYEWNPNPLNPDLVGKNYFGVIRIGGKDTRQQFTQKRAGLRDDITKTGIRFAGEHVFKVGSSLDFLNYESVKQFNYNPVFNFRQTPENYQQPFEVFLGFGDPRIASKNTQFGLYGQDDWTITPKLLVNVGLRWDVETNMFDNDYVTPTPLADSLRGPLAAQIRPGFNINDYISTGGSSRPAYKGAIQPRLGFSYDVAGDQRTVLFGGAGIYYDRDIWNYMLDERFRRQYSVVRIDFRPVCAPGTTNCAVWDPKYYDPAQLRALAVAVGRPQVFAVRNDMRPPKSNQYSAGIRQAVGAYQLTATGTFVRARNGLAYVFGAQGLAPNYTDLLLSTDEVQSRSNQLQLKAEKPLLQSTRWGGSLWYTLSKAELKGEYFFALDDRYGRPSKYPWGTAPGDERHSVHADAILRAPLDFLVSGVLTLGSGQAYSIFDATNGFGPTQRRTYYVYPPKQNFLGIKAFAFRNLDLRAQKDFGFAKGGPVGLSLDLYNVANAANYGCYNNFVPPSTDPPNANFGKPQCVNEGRRLQIGLVYGRR
jgi:hypothetical protein